MRGTEERGFRDLLLICAYCSILENKSTCKCFFCLEMRFLALQKYSVFNFLMLMTADVFDVSDCTVNSDIN